MIKRFDMSFKRTRNIFGRSGNLTQFIAGKDIGYSARYTANVRLGSLTVSGTGGIATASPGNGYTYHYFTSSGTFSIQQGNGGQVDYLVVGGGGGGGSVNDQWAGGGGGAGGFRSGSLSVYTNIPLTVTVGGGGGGDSNGNPSYLGPPSPTIPGDLIISYGGGSGGTGSPVGGPGSAGKNGGSGGGGTRSQPGGEGSRETGTANLAPTQGYPGFTFATPGVGDRSGAGGGAGSGGPITFPSQTGGSGLPAFSGDTGIPASYGTTGPLPGRWFAGGGAGDGGTPGAGGGGADDTNGTVNTGGGGGGKWPGPALPGTSGGSGIVIIRYSNT